MPPTHSPSSIAKAHQCPSRLREYQDPPRITHLDLSKPTEKGTFYHLVIEQWLDSLNRAIQKGEWEDFTSFISSKKARINQLKGDGITVSSEYGGLLSNLVDNCKIEKYLKLVHGKSCDIKSIHTEINLPGGEKGMTLQNEFLVKGIVDCIVKTKKNGVLVIDWKTVLHLKDDDEMMRYKIQLSLYTQLVMREYSLKPIEVKPRLISLTEYNQKHLPIMDRLSPNEWANIGSEVDIKRWTSNHKFSGSHCINCEEAYSTSPCKQRSADRSIIHASQRLHDPTFTTGNSVIDLEIHGRRLNPVSSRSFFVSNDNPDGERILHVQFRNTGPAIRIPDNCVVRCRGKIKFDDGRRTLIVHQFVKLVTE